MKPKSTMTFGQHLDRLINKQAVCPLYAVSTTKLLLETIVSPELGGQYSLGFNLIIYDDTVSISDETVVDKNIMLTELYTYNAGPNEKVVIGFEPLEVIKLAVETALQDAQHTIDRANALKAAFKL